MRALLTFLFGDCFSRWLVTPNSSSIWWLTFSFVSLAFSLHSIRATAEQVSYREFVSGQPANAENYNDNLGYIEGLVMGVDNSGPTFDEVARRFDLASGVFEIELRLSDPSGLAIIKTELEVNGPATQELVTRASEGRYRIYKELKFLSPSPHLDLLFSVSSSFERNASLQNCSGYFGCLYYLGTSSGLLMGEPTAIFLDGKGNSSHVNFKIPNLEDAMSLPLPAGWYRIEPPFQITPVIPESVVVDVFNSDCVKSTGLPNSYEYRLALLTMHHQPSHIGSTEVNREFFKYHIWMVPEKNNVGDGGLSDNLFFRFGNFSQLIGKSEIESGGQLQGTSNSGQGSGSQEFSGSIGNLDATPKLRFERTCTWNGETYVQYHEGDLIFEGPCEEGHICKSTRWTDDGP